MKAEPRNLPASRIVEKFGGITATAAAIGRHRSVVNRWLMPRERGGTDGLVPAKHQMALLELARSRGIDLTPSDFFDLSEKDRL